VEAKYQVLLCSSIGTLKKLKTITSSNQWIFVSILFNTYYIIIGREEFEPFVSNSLFYIFIQIIQTNIILFECSFASEIASELVTSNSPTCLKKMTCENRCNTAYDPSMAGQTLFGRKTMTSSWMTSKNQPVASDIAMCSCDVHCRFFGGTVHVFAILF